MLSRVLATGPPSAHQGSFPLLPHIQSAQCASLPHRRGCVANDTNEWVREEAAKLPEVPIQLALIHIPGAHAAGLVATTAAAG